MLLSTRSLTKFALLTTALISSCTKIPTSPTEQSLTVTRTEILQRIRDEISYYQLSAFWLRGGLGNAPPMDSEHPQKGTASERDPALAETASYADYTKDCNINWFDFNVKSAKVELVNTGDVTTKGKFGLKIPLTGIPGSNSTAPEIDGSLETLESTDDDLTFGPRLGLDGGEKLEPTFVKGLHPEGSPYRTGIASDHSVLDIYPDALRCGELRYHEYLRQMNSDPAPDPSYESVIRKEIENCGAAQSNELVRVQKSPKKAKLLAKFDLRQAANPTRQQPVTPIADRLLSWRDGLIRLARTSALCLPPASAKADDDVLHVRADFKVIKDVDPSISFDILIIGFSVEKDTKRTFDNSILFSLVPVEYQTPIQKDKPKTRSHG